MKNKVTEAGWKRINGGYCIRGSVILVVNEKSVKIVGKFPWIVEHILQPEGMERCRERLKGLIKGSLKIKSVHGGREVMERVILKLSCMQPQMGEVFRKRNNIR